MHARFFAGLLKSGHDPLTDTATKTRINPRRNVTELWVLTRNRTGLFRDLSLAIAASGASITGARLNTGKTGLVMDVFYLLGSDGQAFGAHSPHLLDALRSTASQSRARTNGQTCRAQSPQVPPRGLHPRPPESPLSQNRTDRYLHHRSTGAGPRRVAA